MEGFVRRIYRRITLGKLSNGKLVVSPHRRLFLSMVPESTTRLEETKDNYHKPSYSHKKEYRVYRRSFSTLTVA